MTTNPLGAVLLSDGGVPRTFTASARETISGGEFVFCSGAAGVVTSGAASFAYGDVLVATNASGARCNGIAQMNAGSNSPVTIITRGRLLVAAEGTVVAGDKCAVVGANAVIATAAYTDVIGRALTSASSGGFLLLDLNVA
jgi:hypothetical protein